MRKTTNLQDYMRVSKYARTKADNTKETWEEAVARVMGMHSSAKNIFDILPTQSSLVWDMYNNQEVVGAQRSLQYGGEQLLKHNMRMYNCSGSLLNRTNFFNQLFYILLCGAGAGYRLHKDYVEMMPKLQQPLTGGDVIVIDDSIEGWADSILHLMEAYFYAKPLPTFDYSIIRPEGAYISGGFSAPGPDPLRQCIIKVNNILKTAIGRHLTTFECHRISCIIGDAVISGGIRRSALIAMFELDDIEMLTCKTGNWYTKYPELARANNSVVLNPDEVDYKQFEEIFEYIKQYGEPGIIFSRHKDMVVNPCCFTGDTKIAIADGQNSVTIKELAEKGGTHPVYSARPSKYSSKGWKTEVKSAFAFKSGEKSIVEVHLSNGNVVRTTEDHRFALPSGNYKEAKDLKGETLVNFSAIKEKNYRLINSVSDGHSKQHRLLWEYTNGSIPTGYHIDHIELNKGDFIDNLQLLEASEHMAKTSTERLGENNGIHKIKNDPRYRNNLSAAASCANNPRYSGLTDEYLISVGRQVLDSGLPLTRPNVSKVEPNFPKNFSKNRFKGSWTYYKQIVLGDIQYEVPEVPEYIEKPARDLSKFTDAITVVDVIYTNEIEEVYDLTVEDNHNFFIITEEFGEDNVESVGVLVHNCEVGMYPIIKDSKGEERYGFSLCNLTEIPITNIKDEAHFYKACEAAATLGTIQATYTDFPYLIESDGFNPSEEIVKRDALIGVGLTGMYDNPTLSFNAEIQKNGAKIVKTANRVAAKALGINDAARTTVIKPSGNGSQLYGTASGIHPRHAKNYIRHIQANNNEQALKEFIKLNPDSVIPSIYNPNGESVIGFAVKAPDTAVVRKDLSTKEFIDNVVKTQNAWITEGTNLDHPFYREFPEMKDLTHNVSNTITVRNGEWDIAKDVIWENRNNLCGISMLSEVELDYNQMPFTEVLMPTELVKEYGDAAILSSGLVVDGLEVFDDLWAACDTAITVSQGAPRAYSKDISVSKEKVLQAVSSRLTEDLQYNCDYNGSCVKRVEDIIHIMKFKSDEQNDWVRRFVKFAHRYFNDDLVQCMNCLKHVSLYHKWCKLQEATLIDWDAIKWDNVLTRAGSDTAQGCSGGKCEI